MKFIRWLTMIDKNDALFWTGLILSGVGLYMKAAWLAFSVVGCILLAVSIIGAIKH